MYSSIHGQRNGRGGNGEIIMSIYTLDANNGYWASVVKSDVSKGRTLQQAASDVFTCMLMMNRGTSAAMRTAMAAVYFAGFKVDDVRW